MAAKPNRRSKIKSFFRKVGDELKKVGASVSKSLVANPLGAFKNLTGRSTLPPAGKNAPSVEQPRFTVPGDNATYTTAGLKTRGLTPTSPGVVDKVFARGESAPRTGVSSPAVLGLGQVLGATTAGLSGHEKSVGVLAPPIRSPQRNSPPPLPKAIAPTDPSLINNSVETVNLAGTSGSGGTPGLSSGGSGGTGIMGGATASATASNEGLGVATDQTILSVKEKEAETARLADEARKTKERSWVTDMLEKKEEIYDDLEDKRENLEEQYQIQAKRAEINSLEQTLGKMEVEVQNQVALANDKLGTNNFINNQVQQIARNASPELNRLRSDINFKTGILTQNEALLEKAIEQATATARQDWEDLLWFRKENKNIEDSISPEYKRALDAVEKEKEREYDFQVKETEWKRDMIIEHGLQGLTLNDSVNVIVRSAAKKQAAQQVLKNQNARSIVDARGQDSEGGKLTPAQQKTYEAYKSQITTYKSKEEALAELEKVKFGVIKAVGQSGYDTLVQDIMGSTLKDKSLSWWDKLLGRS